MSFDPTTYPITVQLNVNGWVMVSQVDLNIRLSRIRTSELKSRQQLADLVWEVLLEIIKRSKDPTAPAPKLKSPEVQKQEKIIYVKVAEAAKILGLSQQTLRRKCDSGEIKIKKTKGGHRLVKLPAVNE